MSYCSLSVVKPVGSARPALRNESAFLVSSC
jgi:hypothetical protein